MILLIFFQLSDTFFVFIKIQVILKPKWRAKTLLLAMFFYWFASRQIWGGYSCALLETRLFIQLEGNINFRWGCLVRFVTGPLSQCRSLAVENCINNCVFFKRIWRVCPKNTYVYLESSHNIQVASANLWSFRPKKKLLTMTIFIDNVNEEIGLGQLYLKNVLILCKIKH